ncbi:MAG: hypothetical protein Q7R49_03535 [Candidatus Daviesbacteria bacterium]|nr:hypothetical protein [Candidatus Daviesbacteria bacterium]
MRSKWFEIKPKALELRTNGTSLREVERLLKIPKSTLSGWFRDVKLSSQQELKLRNNWVIALSKARLKAVVWHNSQKRIRLNDAEKQADAVLSLINPKDKSILELTLALLYIGEGFKTSSGTGMGNSDPLILKFFIKALSECYDFDVSKISCELHLRADQNADIVRKYWSKELNLPLTSFRSISIDKRTVGSSTYPTYNGVCVIRCGNIAIQRRLIFLAKKYCEGIINKRAVSSVGRALS